MSLIKHLIIGVGDFSLQLLVDHVQTALFCLGFSLELVAARGIDGRKIETLGEGKAVVRFASRGWVLREGNLGFIQLPSCALHHLRTLYRLLSCLHLKVLSGSQIETFLQGNFPARNMSIKMLGSSCGWQQEQDGGKASHHPIFCYLNSVHYFLKLKSYFFVNIL